MKWLRQIWLVLTGKDRVRNDLCVGCSNFGQDLPDGCKVCGLVRMDDER